MDTTLKTSIWQQYGAAIDMLHDAIKACPDTLWTGQLLKNPDDARYGQFWSIAYHTLFWIDLYLDGTSKDFNPRAPFLLNGFPEQPYSKEDICNYLADCREKCQTIIESLTDEQAYRICTFPWVEVNFLELQLYAMRHVQEHTAQLSLFLAQHDASDLDWITVARSNPA